jgi:NarL family two-component system response regulator LiaR
MRWPSDRTFALVVFRSRTIARKIRILIADDGDVVRLAISTLLRSHPDLEIVGEARDGDEAVRLAARHAPDIVLMELAMPGLDGVETVRRIVNGVSGASVLILTGAKGEGSLFPALHAGAVGFLLKDATAEELVEAIQQVAEKQPVFSAEAARQLVRELSHAPQGEPTGEPLTLREVEVLRGMAERLSDAEIGRALGLGRGAVDEAISSIFRKLNFSRRTQAILYAMKHGIASGYERPAGPQRATLIDGLRLK